MATGCYEGVSSCCVLYVTESGSERQREEMGDIMTVCLQDVTPGLYFGSLSLGIQISGVQEQFPSHQFSCLYSELIKSKWRNIQISAFAYIKGWLLS